MRDVVLGIDLGTSSLKAMLVDAGGAVVAEAAAAYPTTSPSSHAAEQDPEHWWVALATAVRALLGGGKPPGIIRAIGLSGQMHGAVVMDRDDVLVRPCMIWSDQRSGPEAAWLDRVLTRDRTVAVTGTAANASATVTKLLWLRTHEPKHFARVRTVLLPKDYLAFRLTGMRATDPSDASGTAMLDVGSVRWSEDVLSCCGLDPAILPEIRPSAAVTGTLLSSVAARLGLAGGIPVVTGGGDALCAALAMGIDGRDEGRGLVTVGTSGQLLVATRRPAVDPLGRLNTFCHVVEGRWCTLAATMSAGESLAWAARVAGQFGPVTPEALLDLAATASPGAGGVLFAPYLSGERTPHMDASVAAAFTGLRGTTTGADLVRAILEGVAFSLRDGLAALRSSGIAVNGLRGTGGGARSPLWCGILASVLGVPIEVAQPAHGSCFGAAILAGQGVGLAIEPPESGVGSAFYAPDPDLVAFYAERFPAYQAIYPGLRERLVEGTARTS